MIDTHTAAEAVIAVAPNGARRTQKDHPKLPISPQELAETAQRCQAVGANMLHLHVRDDQLQHSLDADRYQRALTACQAAVGDTMLLQITTEAVGQYRPAEQVACIKTVRPQAVSIGLREILLEQTPEAFAQFDALNQWMDQHRVLPQYILYNQEDIAAYLQLWQAQRLCPSHSILLVLGHYSTGVSAHPSMLIERLYTLQQAQCHTPWMLCAFGPEERACTTAALSLGGHVRIGFENNLWHPNGEVAFDNAALISAAQQHCQSLMRPLSSRVAHSLS